MNWYFRCFMQDYDLLKPNQILRSKRKSLSLVIKNDGEFLVRAPLKMKEEDIFKFIYQKKDWIIKKRQDQAQHTYPNLTFEKPEKINILGRSYDILLIQNSRVKLNETTLEVPIFKSKERLVNFLKKYSKNYLSARCALIAELFDFSYYNITISSAKTCWGSCSANNTLHFTYKLIMCPEDVIDYIVVHELCHTKIKNHSAKFWALVETCCPNYKAQEIWLKKNRGIIEII